MSGFELRAKFYPLVPTLAQLVEEAKEGVDYPQVLQLQNKEYLQLCNELDKGYVFERQLLEEGYDPVYGAFICALVVPANGKDGLLLTRYSGQIFAAHLPDCALLDLEEVPCQHISLTLPKRQNREVSR